MARRSEHSREEIKQMVLKAAEDIVLEQGFVALKVRKVASDIGYTVGSIYMVFSSMTDLIMHIKARTWQSMVKYLEAHKQVTASTEDIDVMALAYLEFAIHNQGLWRMLFEHQLPLGSVVPDWYRQENERVIEYVSALFRQLNSVHSDEQVRQAAQILIRAMQGVCMQLLTQEQLPLNTDLAKAEMILLVDCFMRGWINGAE